MPAIALVGAAASIKVGLAVSGLLGGLMVAGGVMTGLGTLTGNKKLTKIGAILGLAGGIGNMISNAGNAASAAASVGGESVSMGTAAGNAGSNAAEFGMAEFGNVADTAGVTVNPVSMSNGIVGTELGAPLPNGASPSDFADTLGGPQAPASAPAMAPGAAETNAARQQIAYVSDSDGLTPFLGADGKPLLQTADPLKSTLGKLGDWAGKGMDYINNPKNANTVKLGSGLVSGAMKSYDQQRQYDQQMAAREAERARFNRSIIGQYTTR